MSTNMALKTNKCYVRIMSVLHSTGIPSIDEYLPLATLFYTFLCK